MLFDERFGAGCDIDAGEDDLMRKKISSIKCNHFLSPYRIMRLTFSSRPSTCSFGENEKYLRVRSILYGYNHHFLYIIFIARMYLKLKNKNSFSFKKMCEYAKYGKKLEQL